MFLPTLAVIASFWSAVDTAPLTTQKEQPHNADCLDDHAQAMLEQAQSTCIEEMTVERENKNLAKDTDPMIVVEEYRDLLDYYKSNAEGNMVNSELRIRFEECIKAKAASLLDMELEKFNKDYRTENMLALLEKVNDIKCQAKANEFPTDVLSDKYVKRLTEKWKRLSLFQRAVKSLLTKVVGFFNKEYVECFKKPMVKDAPLPLLLCGTGSENEKILNACMMDSLTPEAKAQLLNVKAGPAGEKLPALGKKSKRVLDLLVCHDKKKHEVRPKRSLRGAWRLLKEWPAHLIQGVCGPVFLALFWMVMLGLSWGFKTNGKYLLCGLAFGAVSGAVIGIGLMLYSVFGIPWRLLTELFNKKIEYDGELYNYEHEYVIGWLEELDNSGPEAFFRDLPNKIRDKANLDKKVP